MRMIQENLKSFKNEKDISPESMAKTLEVSVEEIKD